MKIAFLFLGLLFAFSSLATPLFAQAQETIQLGPSCNTDINGDGKIRAEDGEQACGFCQIFQLISKIVGFIMFPIVPLIASLFVVIGGFMIFISGGDEKRLKQGQDLLKAVAIGVVLVYAAWVLVNTFFMWIGIAEWQGFNLKESWWNIPCN
ncbi:MAG: hypothetical protein HYT50_00730 [Candidatus Wildermuthbacteria bacterium]|nr:hypothetical protein [Candidatus Wildermuthbacteria bacterium]